MCKCNHKRIASVLVCFSDGANVGNKWKEYKYFVHKIGFTLSLFPPSLSSSLTHSLTIYLLAVWFTCKSHILSINWNIKGFVMQQTACNVIICSLTPVVCIESLMEQQNTIVLSYQALNTYYAFSILSSH